MVLINGGNAYQLVLEKSLAILGVFEQCVLWMSLQGDHEAQPREKEYSSIDIDRVEHWDGSGFPVDWVYLWSFPKKCNIESHGELVKCENWNGENTNQITGSQEVSSVR